MLSCLVHTQRIFCSRCGKKYQPRLTKSNQEYQALSNFAISPNNIHPQCEGKVPGPSHLVVAGRQTSSAAPA